MFVNTLSRYIYIDILRGVAILLVLGLHARHFFSPYENTPSFVEYGMYGVQLFFILSALSLLISLKNNDSPSWSMFWIRRVFRVAPMYLVGVCAFGILYISGVKFWLFLHERINLTDVVSNLFMVHGLFPTSVNMLIPGGWSLGAEVMFYAVFPLIWFVVHKVKYKTSGVWVIFAISLLMSFVFRNMYIPQAQGLREYEYGYFSLFSQLPVFILGYVVYQYLFVEKRLETILLLMCISTAVILPTQNDIHSFVQFHVAIASLFSLCVIWIHAKRTYIEKIFYHLSYIGTISYSMYISNMLCLYVLRDVFKIREFIDNYFILYLLLCLVTISVSTVLYHTIENPWIMRGKALTR